MDEKRKKTLVIRFHKFKKIHDAHQYYYSEMQLYLHHRNEEELFPEDSKKCHQKYLENIELIIDAKEQVMPHYEKVVEAREKAEEFISI